MTINGVALGALAARTAIFLNTDFTGITATFLMIRVRYLLQTVSRPANSPGPVVIGIAPGNATLVEIQSAMIENNTAGPADVTQSLTEDTAFTVYQNTVVLMSLDGSATELTPASGSDWIPVGGKKGIPAQEGSGWTLFAYNAGSVALATNAIMDGLAHIQGVWLRD